MVRSSTASTPDTPGAEGSEHQRLISIPSQRNLALHAGSKQEFGPDGQLLRAIESGVNTKKATSDIIRYVPGTPERVDVIRRMFDLCIAGYGYHYIAVKLRQVMFGNHAKVEEAISSVVFVSPVFPVRECVGNSRSENREDGRGRCPRLPVCRNSWRVSLRLVSQASRNFWRLSLQCSMLRSGVTDGD